MSILKIASYVMSVKILPSWKSRKFFSAQTYSKTHISVSSIAIHAKPPANCTLEQVKLRTTALQNMSILTLRFRGQLPSFLGYSRRGRNDSKNQTRAEKACEINIIGKLKSFMGWTQKIWPLLSFHGNERKSWLTLVRTTPFFWLLNKSVSLCDSFGYLILFVRRCSLRTA